MTSTPTPGPWKVRYADNGYPYQIVAPDQDDTRPGIVGTCITRWASISLPSSPEGLANARLIAAAPDLLAACKAMVSAWESKGSLAWQPENNPTLLEGMKAALAKAEGGA